MSTENKPDAIEPQFNNSQQANYKASPESDAQSHESTTFDYDSIDHHDATLSFSNTTTAQVILDEAREIKLSQLDRQWQQERDALAYKADYQLSLDMDHSPARSVHAEYVERRERHEERHWDVQRKHQEQREFIRDHGTTLMDEFTTANDTSCSERQATFHRAMEPSQGRSR